MAGVASAAIVSGELIIGLDDGTIIRAGYVQGPQGLQGDRGPMGATGQPGRDGNGVLHGAGVPVFDDGKDGDFFIDTKAMKFYGPKVAGKWGSGVPLLPKDRGMQLPTGMRAQGGAAGARAFAAGISGPSSAGGAPVANTAGLDTITGHNKPLVAATATPIAHDPKGDVMHVLVFAQAAAGSWYGEVVATRDANRDTAEVIAWETQLGTTPPTLTFDTQINTAGDLELIMTSDIDLTNLRGKVIYV